MYKKHNNFFNTLIEKEQIRTYDTMPESDIEEIINFLNLPENELSNNTSFICIGEGTCGVVFAYKSYAIKLFFDGKSGYGNRDEDILKEVHHMTSYPSLYLGHDSFIVTELIEGKILSSTCYKDLLNANGNSINVLLDDIKETLKLGIIPDDTHDENMMLSTNGYFKMIDTGFFMFRYTTEEEYNNDEFLLKLIDSRSRDYIIKVINNLHKEIKVA